MEQEEEIIDEMSAEAQFAKLKKPQDQEPKKILKKKSKIIKESPDDEKQSKISTKDK